LATLFLDVESLRADHDWEPRLLDAISGSDVFYLFWSSNAEKSNG